MRRVLAAVVAAVLLVGLLSAVPNDAGASADAAGCLSPRKRVATKMDYGSGILGPLGTHVLDGDMATADVGIFGDSITARGCGELKAHLAGLGKTLATDAQSSREVAKTADDIEAYAVLPPIVIVAAGTNNIFAPTVFGAQMDRILAHLEAKGVEHVLWVDVQVCRTGASYSTSNRIADQRNSMAINMQIHERLPASKIVPWAWAFIANPSRLSLYLQDGVHPWVGAGDGHGDGTAHWRAWIMTKLGPLL